jgi:hypothetical protein
MRKIFGTGTTIVQVLPRPQGFALHTTDQVIFRERPTSTHHISNIALYNIITLTTATHIKKLFKLEDFAILEVITKRDLSPGLYLPSFTYTNLIVL